MDKYFLASIVESSEDSIVTVDFDMIVTTWNEAAERLMGYSAEEAIGMSLTKMTFPEDLQKLVEDIERIKNSGFVEIFETEREIQGGERIFLEIQLSPVKDDKGKVVGVATIARDRSARRKLEAEAVQRRSLEVKFAEQEQTALKDQLRQSQKMEAVGSLAGGIAHDFNNLLTAINGYTELTLRMPDIKEQIRGNLEEVKRAGDRAAQLTRQLLAFSRKQVLQPRVVDLNEVVTEIERMLSRLIGADIDLQMVLAEDLGKIHADPGQLEQVIVNLALNARGAMPEGGKLTIETANVTLDESYASTHITVTPGRYVMVAVSDTGEGMSDEVKERAFEPYFTTKEVGQGTGLGLATVYGIVKQSGGSIWIYSEVGVGTTFKVYFPLHLGEEVREEKKAVELDLNGTERVLVVEDEDQVRELVAEVLSTYGYDVVTAENGEKALALCRDNEKAFDLLLTDIIMPGISGPKLSEQTQTACPGIRTLYMSGYTNNAVIRHNVLAEGLSYLQKPFSPAALARKVREVLSAGEK